MPPILLIEGSERFTDLQEEIMATKATGGTRKPAANKPATTKPAAKAAAKKPAAKAAPKAAAKKPAAKKPAAKTATKPRKKAAGVKSGAAQSMGVLDGSMKNVFRSAFLNRP